MVYRRDGRHDGFRARPARGARVAFGRHAEPRARHRHGHPSLDRPLERRVRVRRGGDVPQHAGVVPRQGRGRSRDLRGHGRQRAGRGASGRGTGVVRGVPERPRAGRAPRRAPVRLRQPRLRGLHVRHRAEPVRRRRLRPLHQQGPRRGLAELLQRGVRADVAQGSEGLLVRGRALDRGPLPRVERSRRAADAGLVRRERRDARSVQAVLLHPASAAQGHVPLRLGVGARQRRLHGRALALPERGGAFGSLARVPQRRARDLAGRVHLDRRRVAEVHRAGVWRRCAVRTRERPAHLVPARRRRLQDHEEDARRRQGRAPGPPRARLRRPHRVRTRRLRGLHEPGRRLGGAHAARGPAAVRLRGAGGGKPRPRVPGRRRAPGSPDDGHEPRRRQRSGRRAVRPGGDHPGGSPRRLRKGARLRAEDHRRLGHPRRPVRVRGEVLPLDRERRGERPDRLQAAGQPPGRVGADPHRGDAAQQLRPRGRADLNGLRAPRRSLQVRGVRGIDGHAVRQHGRQGSVQHARGHAHQVPQYE